VTFESNSLTTILVVDDDEQILDLLKSFLEQKGMRVLLAQNAHDALARTDLDDVHVALLDVRLQGTINGHALQQELNRRYPDMAKILMSGQADLDDAIAAFAEQAFSFAKKPFSLREIGILIERAAYSVKLEKQNQIYAERLRESNIALTEKISARTAETQRYQQILAHLFQVSSRLGRIERPDNLLDFICQSVVEAGAFRRAAVVLADEKYLIKHIGVWQEGGVPDALRDALRSLRDTPLRPFEFDRTQEQIGSAIYSRTPQREPQAEESGLIWQPGDQLFMPVRREDGPILGYLSLEAPADNSRPTKDIVQLLDVLLSHGALHLETQELRDELKKRAYELELRVHERTKELRQSEERFSRLVNATNDIVYITDENDKLTFLNEAFTRTLGYVRENYFGRTLRRLLEDITTANPINHRAIQELASYTGEHTLHHVEILTRQGDKRTLEINRTIIKQGGAVRGSQGIVRDITEHRILLQQLVSSERLAATGRLAAGVAHEINNPLQGMSSQLSTIQKKVIGHEDPTANIELLQEGIDRIRHIVRGMLDLHRGPVMQQVTVNLNEIAEKVLVMVSQQMHDHNIHIERALEPKLPTILGSPQELQQVVLNLVLNASEAMPNGGKLFVSTRHEDDVVELQVKDTGVGIAEEHLSQIFEPFFTFKPTGSGTGLGLYLSKNIMDLHRGRISVESEKDKGASFILSFPKF
jgi:PAS domain S-box-containing protein